MGICRVDEPLEYDFGASTQCPTVSMARKGKRSSRRISSLFTFWYSESRTTNSTLSWQFVGGTCALEWLYLFRKTWRRRHGRKIWYNNQMHIRCIYASVIPNWGKRPTLTRLLCIGAHWLKHIETVYVGNDMWSIIKMISYTVAFWLPKLRMCCISWCAQGLMTYYLNLGIGILEIKAPLSEEAHLSWLRTI